MKRTFKFSESDMAKVVVDDLKELGYKVYQEVQIHRYGKCADIVAVQNSRVWVIECKLSLGLDVLEQAMFWTTYAHYVSVAVPYRRDSNDVARWVMKQLGIGWLQVRMSEEDWRNDVSHTWGPTLHRKALTKQILDTLTPEHETFAQAGNANGRRLTAFSITCRNLASIVASEPGIPLASAISKLKHHYGSETTARSCLAKWIEAGSVRNVKMHRDGRKILLYPDWYTAPSVS